jgi:uncharacterized membrane protein YphA (DoxX/SURF4 family)
MALLLLRTVVGLSVIVQGTFYLTEPKSTLATLFVGSIAVATGGLLLVGFLTPLAGLVAGIGIVGIALSWLLPSTPNLLESASSIAFALAILVAVIVLGPGAFAIDARLFGRREIIIPLSAPESEQ